MPHLMDITGVDLVIKQLHREWQAARTQANLADELPVRETAVESLLASLSHGVARFAVTLSAVGSFLVPARYAAASDDAGPNP